MAIVKTLKNELEYDTETKQYIFNGRNKSALMPEHDPMRGSETIEAQGGEEKVEHHLQMTVDQTAAEMHVVITLDEAVISDQTVADGSSIKTIVVPSLDLVTQSEARAMSGTHLVFIGMPLIYVDGTEWAPTPSSQMVGIVDFGRMPWQATASKETREFKAEDFGLEYCYASATQSQDESGMHISGVMTYKEAE